ncbi:UrcA family protein [Lichenicoccus roseus]|uniref:UrcA family protein n=1 Tax=Lichenicoccus roseus TaxID=2683649 RepID=A0A5R9JCA7_9PROT|nr:UrcA family protein [Lichenicoccus roseus]TLU73016.1 UrcA family protein [Lichenicoccus roseus]
MDSLGKLATLAILFTGAALILDLTPASAAAPSREEVTADGDMAVVTRAVPVSDLNLAAPDDQRRLHHRISVAARRVCMDAGGNTIVSDDSLFDCYQRAMGDAWAVARQRIQMASTGSALVAQATASAAPVEVATALGQ